MQAIGNFDADRAFLAFLNATNQKDITGEILYALIRDLAGKEIILSGDSPVELYIPGIGEGFQAQEIAEAIYHISGRQINIHGSDLSDSFVNAATQRFKSSLYINQAEITIGDAFTPGGITVKHIDITAASHLLYYATSQTAVTNFVLNITNTLKDDGVAILIHDAPDSNLAELRSTYNPSFLSKPTLAIDMAAHNIGLPVFKIGYTSSLAFLDTRLVKLLKALESYDEFRGEDDFVQTAGLMQFIFQRSLSALERENLLGKAIDDVLGRLDPRTNELEIRSQCQIILSSTLGEKQAAQEQLHASILFTTSQIPQIKKRYPNPVLASAVTPKQRR
jgi:hypothetical protein